ncbi:MAG: DUF131 domain-containing protein [Nitrososphaerales archaeon]
MVEQLQLLSVGLILVMLGIIVTVFSLKPRGRGSTGIILLGPIPIVWGGSNKSLLVVIISVILLLFIVLPMVLMLWM